MRRKFSRKSELTCRTILFGVVCAVAGLATACSPEAAKAKRSSEKEAVAKGPAWNWESYPPRQRMRIAQLPCQLQPKSTITVVSPISGLLRIYAPSPQSELKANFLWGEFEPEILAQDEMMLAESLKKLEDLEKVQWEIEYPRKKRELELKLKESERELKRVQMFSDNPELARKAFGTGSNTNTLRPETLDIARETFELLQRQMTYLTATNYAALGFDLTAQRTEWKRRELDFQRRRQQSRFEMPFDGKLTIAIPISQGVTNYPVNLGQELAVARDISAVRARVVMENAAWSGIPSERLRVVVTTGGRALEAHFVYQKIEKIQNREELAYYFEFPKAKATEAARLIGANNQCDLWADLSEAARIVPKMAVILHQPDTFKSGNWNSGVASTFPGARLLLEGQADLAIVVPESEAKKTSVKLSSAK